MSEDVERKGKHFKRILPASSTMNRPYDTLASRELCERFYRLHDRVEYWICSKFYDDNPLTQNNKAFYSGRDGQIPCYYIEDIIAFYRKHKGWIAEITTNDEGELIGTYKDEKNNIIHQTVPVPKERYNQLLSSAVYWFILEDECLELCEQELAEERHKAEKRREEEEAKAREDKEKTHKERVWERTLGKSQKFSFRTATGAVKLHCKKDEFDFVDDNKKYIDNFTEIGECPRVVAEAFVYSMFLGKHYGGLYAKKMPLPLFAKSLADMLMKYVETFGDE